MPHQRTVLFEDSHRFKVLVWHRRARKTTTSIIELVKQAHLKVGPYWHVFPTYREGKDAIWRDQRMLFSVIPENLILRKNETELIVYFKNGSYYQIMGADNPDRLRGAGPLGIVFDEYDSMKEDVWPVVQPIVRANGGWAWFCGTPKGKLKLFELYQRGQIENKEWKSWRLKASESGIIAKDQLENAKATMSQALYNQEFETEFLESEGSVFRNVRQSATADPQKPMTDHLYVMGVDLAKVQDFTVITVYDRTTNAQVYQDRFQTLAWPFQKARIIETAKHYNNALVTIDATGLGDPIADDLTRSGIAVEAFKITSESKKDIIEKLSIWIEQGKMRMLPIQETLYEFDNFSYEIGPSGKVRYGARQGFHDDIVISHALSIWGLQPLYIEKRIPQLNQIQQLYKEKAKSYGKSEEDYANDYDAY